MLEIEGVILDIIYKNEDNGYVIAVLESEEDTLTIVGNMPLTSEGENISVEGNFIYHKKYGEQFKVENYKLVTPDTEEGIVKYLSSGLLPGIGQKTAEKIVEKFGLESLDTMQYNPERLTEVDGIGKKRIKQISRAFEDQREIKEIIIYLQNYDISPNLGIKIYKKYGNESINKINENPYRLSSDIYGIGFTMADKIAQKMGAKQDSKYRIRAGIEYALRQASLNGHTYLPEDILIRNTIELLRIESENIAICVMDLALSQEIKIEVIDGVRCIYMMSYYSAEAGVGKRLVELSKADIKKIEIDIDDEVERIESELNISFAKKQKEAISRGIEQGVFIITGGPGTGKTTIINSIINIYENQKMDVLLAAPTGRAAKRMSEATDREAKTIHRLLEYTYGDQEIGMFFNRDAGTPIESDVIIIDEVSMVDILLMNNLLKAIIKGTRLIIVGDTDQLPSVGAGNVLRDIIDSGTMSIVKLDEIFRQAKESMIVVNAHRINNGQLPIVNEKEKDFFMMRRIKSEEIVGTIIELAKERLPNFKGYDSLRDIQILSASRKGDVGVNTLNKQLQSVLNPPRPYKQEKQYGDTLYRAGDKVMQIKNNYNTVWEKMDQGRVVEKGEGVFNGDMGFISYIDKDNSEMLVVFDDDREVLYDFGQLDELNHAYAITIHKSQGSEFPVVIIPITWGPPMLLTRNLIYTGVTRARELVVLVGEERYLKYMIDNNKITERYSGLKWRLDQIHDYITI